MSNINRANVLMVMSPKASYNSYKVARTISGFLNDRFRLFLLAPKVKQDIQDVVCVQYEKTNLSDTYGITTMIDGITSVTRKIDIDICINVSQISTVGVSICIAGLIRDFKTVLRFTGDPQYVACMHDKWIRRLSKYVLHVAIPNALALYNQNFITLGPRYKRKIENINNNADVYILPQPIEYNRFSKVNDVSHIYKDLGIGSSSKIVLFVGRLNWSKGIDRIYKISRQLKIRSSDILFLLVGPVIGKYAKKLSSLPNTIVTGPIANSKLPPYYHIADRFIFPSRTEGLPNVILEALASRVPIMASPVGEIPSVLDRTSSNLKDYTRFILRNDVSPESFDPDLLPKNLSKEYMRVFARLTNT